MGSWLPSVLQRPHVRARWSVDAVAAALQTRGERAAIVEAAGCAIRSGLTASPLAAFHSVRRLLLVALPILWIGVQAIVIGRAAVRGAAIRSAGCRRRRAGAFAVIGRSVGVRRWRGRG